MEALFTRVYPAAFERRRLQHIATPGAVVAAA
jgi:hypothetical protein